MEKYRLSIHGPNAWGGARKMKTRRPTSSLSLSELDVHTPAEQANVLAIIWEQHSVHVPPTACSDDVEGIHCIK